MPLTELYNAVDPQGVILNRGDFGRNFFPGEDPFESSRGQFPDAYRFGKTFVSPSFSIRGGGNGVTSIDDPTYLGFSLRFDILSPLFSGAIIPTSPNSQIGPGESTEGTNSIETVSQAVNPVRQAGESAIAYLEAIGETTRANYLKSFIQGIREINEKRPYYWQTIEGLSEAWNKTFLMADPYSGSADGEGITVGCLEAMDLKISALFNLYKAAVYDVKYKRTILPKNLMYFNVYVDILEIRKFKSIKSVLTRGNTNDVENDTFRLINENTATITFKFNDCVWDLTATGNVFANVTNAGDNSMATSSMKWFYSSVEMESQFPGLDSSLSDAANLQPRTLGGKTNINAKGIGKKILDNASNAAQTAGARVLSNLKKGVVNRVERTARSLIQAPLLGNAFGQRNQVLAAIRNPQSLINAVAGASFQTNSSQSVGTSNINLGDPIFSNQNNAQSQSRLQSDNIFGTSPSGPPPLNPNNVFE